MNLLYLRPLEGLAASFLAASLFGCVIDARPEGWGTSTHDKSAAPDYSLVFDVEEVRELHLVIDAEDADTMRQDAQSLANGVRSDDPVYVPATVQYGDVSWTHVGVRYRGSLRALREHGIEKLSLRLHFDKFEDAYPEIDDQRFYGFQHLVLSANQGDPSLLREVFVSELMLDRGVPAARAAFVRLWVDTGEGPVYWGLYTLLEDPSDDAMLETQFGSSDGNAYKAEGPGADWQDFHEDSYEKKTRTEAADYGDIEGAIAALSNDDATGAAWRDALEGHFDVDGFLRWLAVDTVMQNEDSYGKEADNYYLYGPPDARGQLRWIPWDHNQALDADDHGPPDMTPREEMLHERVGERWPLIYRTLRDDTYREQYTQWLREAGEGLFAEDAALARIEHLYTLIEPYVVGELGEQPPYTHLDSPAEFADAVDGPRGLRAHVQLRHLRLNEALGGD